MDYSRNRLEEIVIGTMLNDFGDDGFMKSCRLSLRKELFKNRQNAFIFGILDAMFKDGLTETTPKDVLEYTNDKEIKYGNMSNFASYMCGLASCNYAHTGFKKYVKELVAMYIKENRFNGTKG